MTPSGWIAVSALDFTQLKFLDTNFQINGNNADNRTANITATVNVTVPAGYYLAIRWFDGEKAGQNDAGMGIDNLSVNFTGVAVPEPTALLFGGIVCGMAGMAYGWRKWFSAQRV